MPSCCCYACLTFHCSDPEEFLRTFFRGSGRNVQHFFLSPPSNEVSAIPKPETTNVSCYRFVTWQCIVWEGLFSVIWFGKSWLSPPVLDCGYAKYAPQCCAHNMWQEISQTDGDVLTRLWRAVSCPSFRRSRLTPNIVLIRRFVCARRYEDWSIWCIVSVGCRMFPPNGVLHIYINYPERTGHFLIGISIKDKIFSHLSLMVCTHLVNSRVFAEHRKRKKWMLFFFFFFWYCVLSKAPCEDIDPYQSVVMLQRL